MRDGCFFACWCRVVPEQTRFCRPVCAILLHVCSDALRNKRREMGRWTLGLIQAGRSGENRSRCCVAQCCGCESDTTQSLLLTLHTIVGKTRNRRAPAEARPTDVPLPGTRLTIHVPTRASASRLRPAGLNCSCLSAPPEAASLFLLAPSHLRGQILVCFLWIAQAEQIGRDQELDGFLSTVGEEICHSVMALIHLSRVRHQ